MKNELDVVLLEYSELLEYSGLTLDGVNKLSLFGDRPINIAATRGLINEVKVLLDNGADINNRGEHGYTPLHNAVEQSNIATVKFLLEKGADLEVKNDNMITASELALLLEEKEIYNILNN